MTYRVTNYKKLFKELIDEDNGIERRMHCEKTIRNTGVSAGGSVEHTNFQDIRVGTVVNLEFDILGKYIARLQEIRDKR